MRTSYRGGHSLYKSFCVTGCPSSVVTKTQLSCTQDRKGCVVPFNTRSRTMNTSLMNDITLTYCVSTQYNIKHYSTLILAYNKNKIYLRSTIGPLLSSMYPTFFLLRFSLYETCNLRAHPTKFLPIALCRLYQDSCTQVFTHARIEKR